MLVSYLRRAASSALTAAWAFSSWALVPGEFLLDGGNAFGELGDFVLQAADFLVRVLQFQQIFYIWKHPTALILARGAGVCQRRSESQPERRGHLQKTQISMRRRTPGFRALGVKLIRSP